MAGHEQEFEPGTFQMRDALLLIGSDTCFALFMQWFNIVALNALVLYRRVRQKSGGININDYDMEVYSFSLLWCISCIGLWCYTKDDQAVRLEIEYKL
jgi:hypothetical protein